jgi:flavorubredoxin
MKVLNLYFSTTGNTEKVARRISGSVQELGREVDTLKVTSKDIEIDILNYNFVFVGSGVYGQLPGTPLIELFKELMQKYSKAGEVKPTSPRRPSAYAVVYCTYGGAHTGINEAVPAVKYMGQLFDHLGYTIMAEWYIVGDYKTERLRGHSVGGRLGDIRGRPNEEDLRDVAARVKGILQI